MKRVIIFVRKTLTFGLAADRCFITGASLRFYVYGKTAMPDDRFAVVGHFVWGSANMGGAIFLFICK